MLNGATSIAGGQEIAQATADFQQVVPAQARQNLALPGSPLPGERDCAGEAIQVLVAVKRLKEQTTQGWPHGLPASGKISSRSARCAITRSGRISPLRNCSR